MTSKQDTWIIGGILAVLGLIAIASLDIMNGILLLGIGVVFMSVVSEEFREKVFGLFFSVLEEIVEGIKGLLK